MSEILNRVRLLMNYDMKKTLTENVNVINEDAITKAAREGSVVAKELESVLKFMKQDSKVSKELESMKGAPGGAVKNSDDLLMVIKNNMLSGQAKGVMQSGILKSSGNRNLINLAAKDLTSSPQFAQKYFTEYQKGGKPALESALKNSGKYSDSAITQIVKETEGKQNLLNDLLSKKIGSSKEVKAAESSKTVETSKVSNEIEKVTKNPNTKNWWKRFKDGWKDLSWKQKLGIIAASGLGIGLLWYFLSREKSINFFPDCMVAKMTDVDLKKMAESGFDKGISVTNTGNKQLDALGGLLLYSDNTAEIQSTKNKGTWSVSGNKVMIAIGNINVEIPCENTTPIKDKGKKEGGGTGVSKYKVCSGPSYELYCKSEDIRKAQRCVGVRPDSALGPLTKAALEKAGVSLPLTQDGINKVCSGKSSSTTTTTTINPLSTTSIISPEDES